MVKAYTAYGAIGDIYGYVEPFNIDYIAEGDGASNMRVELLVPNGSTYQIAKTSGTGTIAKWYELR